MIPSESLFLDLRGLRYHVRSWGRSGAPKLFLLHGWMDVSASFQFVVDALDREWNVLAPDWRGYGLSAWTRAQSYWYADYFADLERLLDHFQPGEAVDLVGHSMGGNVACLYAGIRPQRVRRLVNLEGLGMRNTDPAQAPGRYARWLDDLGAEQRFRTYAGFEELERRLREGNPRLTQERAAFLARHWGHEDEEGRVVLRSDPRHKIVNPVLYRAEEAAACLRAISARVLWVQGELTDVQARLRIPDEEIAGMKRGVTHLEHRIVPGAGHMLHHDQPERLAEVIESFLADAGSTDTGRA